MAENKAITGQTLIGEIVAYYPDLVDTLLGIGMHCMGCPASQMESLEEACMVHGIDSEELVEVLNAKIAEKA
ncbi:MAG: DUF1858 domain-containing protein [Eubacterium sp.]|nr:DUF1858 domain-containing protein [Eubacterium sp.]